MTASLVFLNANVWTGRRRAQAVACRHDRLVAVGSDDEVRDFIDAGTEVIDLRGAFVCPGFHDAHLHLWGGGRRLLHLDLTGLRSLAEVRARVAERVSAAPPGEWVTGWGWDHTLWGAREFPTRLDLDDIAPNHPVCLTRTDGHARWYNSAALRLAAITRTTRAPTSGEIIRDAAGEPTGVLTETAIDLVPVHANEPSKRDCLLAALAEARRFGVTSLGDGSADFEAYDELIRDNLLTVRVYAWGKLDGDWELWEDLRRRFTPSPANRPSGRFAPVTSSFCCGFLKAFLDGSLGSRTAAMFEPYDDAPEKSGLRLMETARLIELLAEADRRGFQVGLHAIGDAAVRQALDAFEAARVSRGHRIEHLQFVHPDDFARFAQLGVIASIQPCHLMNDLRSVEQRVGRVRCVERGYRWRTLAANAPAIPLGTDWPVESLNPFENLYAAVTRCELDGNPGWPSEESLSIERALRAYTYDSACAEFADHARGTIEVGKLADLIVVDRDLIAVPPDELKNARALITVFGGRIVYRAAC